VRVALTLPQWGVLLAAAERQLAAEISGYIDELRPGLGRARDEAVSAAVEFLKRHNYRQFRNEEEFAERLWPEVAASFGRSMETGETTEEIEAAVEAVYRYYRVKDRSAWGTIKAPAKFTFSSADVRTLNFSKRLDRFNLGKFIEGDASRSTGLANLREQWMEQGEGLFGRGSDRAIEAFRSATGKTIDELSDYQAKRVVDTSVVRMRSMAQIQQATEAEIESLEWVTVGGACEECSPLEGRTFALAPAQAEVTRISGMSPEEYRDYLLRQNDVKKRMGSVAYLRSGGAQPPLHPNCRCRVVVSFQKA